MSMDHASVPKTRPYSMALKTPSMPPFGQDHPVDHSTRVYKGFNRVRVRLDQGNGTDFSNIKTSSVTASSGIGT